MQFEQGEPAPWFKAPTRFNGHFAFDAVAGRCIVLSFLGSTLHAGSRAVAERFRDASERFDAASCRVFFVSVDRRDLETRALGDDRLFTTFWDLDRALSRLYGAVDRDGVSYRPYTLVLDPRLRVLDTLRIASDAEAHVERVLSILDAQPAPGVPEPAMMQAPVLMVPRIFTPDLCRTLIDYHATAGSKVSGFMRERFGKTVAVFDRGFKRRRDSMIEDETLRTACRGAIEQRLLPQVERALGFRATRLERYLVACYDDTDQGFFRAHRDNTTRGTAHRKFAVTINLNAEAYEGGDLMFPEYGQRLHRAPTGGAVVFSCGLLHEARPVTRGTRYCFLPFLYDEAGRRLREKNLRYVETGPRAEAQSREPRDIDGGSAGRRANGS